MVPSALYVYITFAWWITYEVEEVESRHEKDGHPRAKAAVRDLGLDAGEQAQGDEVDEGDGAHVRPDSRCDGHAPHRKVFQGAPKIAYASPGRVDHF